MATRPLGTGFDPASGWPADDSTTFPYEPEVDLTGYGRFGPGGFAPNPKLTGPVSGPPPGISLSGPGGNGTAIIPDQVMPPEILDHPKYEIRWPVHRRVRDRSRSSAAADAFCRGLSVGGSRLLIWCRPPTAWRRDRRRAAAHTRTIANRAVWRPSMPSSAHPWGPSEVPESPDRLCRYAMDPRSTPLRRRSRSRPILRRCAILAGRAGPRPPGRDESPARSTELCWSPVTAPAVPPPRPAPPRPAGPAAARQQPNLGIYMIDQPQRPCGAARRRRRRRRPPGMGVFGWDPNGPLFGRG